MRTHVKLIKKAVVLACLFFSSNVKAETIDTLVIESDAVTGFAFQIPSAAARSQRTSNKRYGKITADFSWPTDADESWKNMIQSSFYVAAETWQSYLDNDSIALNIAFNDEANAPDIKTTVYYCDANSIAYPVCLYRKVTGGESGAQTDAKIVLNSSVKWDIGIGTDTGKNNLTLAFMQSIAHSMGFGATTHIYSRNNNDIITRSNVAFSPFEKIIFNASGQKLSDIHSTRNRNSVELNDFVQGIGGPVYAYQQAPSYQLYAPETFDERVSLKYLNNGNALMSISPTEDLDLEVDAVTIKLLRQAGWDIASSNTVTIVGEGIDSTGITSAYQSHRFYIQESLAISNHHWTLTLQTVEGNDTIVCSSSNQDFVVPAISSENLYRHSQEGEIKGTVHFSGMSGSQSVAADYHVTFELKPHITYLSDVQFSPGQESEFYDYYNLDFDVRYEGSHYLYTTVEEEYSMFMESFYFNKPYYTHIHLENVDFYGIVWVTIEAVNGYGSDSKTLELEPNSLSKKANFSAVESSNLEGTSFEVYDLAGKHILFADTLDDVHARTVHGRVYIVKLMRNGSVCKTIKYHR